MILPGDVVSAGSLAETEHLSDFSFLGRTFPDGWREALKRGIPVFRVSLTAPFPRNAGKGILRVIRERETPQGREWILAYPEYHRIRGAE